MSIVVGAKDEHEIVIGTDSAIGTGDHSDPPWNAAKPAKLVRCSDLFAIGVVGWMSWPLYLESYLRARAVKEGDPEQIYDTADVFNFFQSAWAWLTEQGYVNAPHKEQGEHPWHSLESSFIVASPHGLWEVAASFGVFEANWFVAAGSGKEYAWGAYHALRADPLTKPVSGAYVAAAVNAACEFNRDCCLPLKLARFKRTGIRDGQEGCHSGHADNAAGVGDFG